MYCNSDFFHCAAAYKADEENYKTYGTYDLDEIHRIEEYNKKVVNAEVASKTEEKVQKMLPEIKKKAHTDAVRQVRAEYRISEGTRIYDLSPFISETVIVNGQLINRNKFLPDMMINDPYSENVRLYFDDINDLWLVRVKSSLPKIISRFVVIGCLIVDVNGPGSCRAYVVFLKGGVNPLIFWGGIVEASELRKQTQFHQKGFSYARKDLYHETFMRSLSMCNAVGFLTLPKHAGWNVLPGGKLIFVSSQFNIPELCKLFDDNGKKHMRNIFQDIVLEKTEKTLDSIAIEYKSLFPEALPIKIGTVISTLSRLLPHYYEEGLVQDRLWVVETSDDVTVKAMTSAIQNRHHNTIEILSSSERITNIQYKLKKYVDCSAVMRHSINICSKHNFEKMLRYLYELLQNGYAEDDTNRFGPVLFIDNAGIIPEEFQIHQLTINDRILIDDTNQIQRIAGEIDYHIVKLVERNPDVCKQRIKTAVAEAKKKVATLPKRSQSRSAIMFISTAFLLKEINLLNEADVKSMLQWLCFEAKERKSMSQCTRKAVSNTLSELICCGKLPIANQFTPPFWTPNKGFIASDGSLNIIKDILETDILSEIFIGKNKALQYLKEEEVLINDSKGDQKTWTVHTEDGKKLSKRFYSFSRDLLNFEANKIVDETIASDLFHKFDKHIDNFFPFIKHQHMDIFAGQIITDYKHGTPFIAVTGSVGSGKTDWMMMQVWQRARAGDVVVVLDPTNAFCRDELSGHKIPDNIIDEYFTFWDMSLQGWPINILDFEGCEDITQRVQRLSSLLVSGMHLTGPNQKAIVMTKAEEWLEEYELDNNLSIYNLPARLDSNADERKLKTKLNALLSTVKNVKNGIQSPGWDKLLADQGKVLVISAGRATISSNANPFDLLLDTLYAYKDKNRDKMMTIILDEAQTLNHQKDSTLINILSRVRKLNIAVILASQDYLNKSLQKIYDYCGTHIFFRPMGEDCIKAVAELTKLDEDIIRTLPDFHCAIMGAAYSEYYQKNIQLSSAIIGETYRPSYVEVILNKKCSLKAALKKFFGGDINNE